MKLRLTFLVILSSLTSCDTTKTNESSISSKAKSLDPGTTRKELYHVYPPISNTKAQSQIILGISPYQDALFVQEEYESRDGLTVQTNWNLADHSKAESLKSKLRKSQTENRPTIDDILNASIADRQLNAREDFFKNGERFLSDENPLDQLINHPRVFKP